MLFLLYSADTPSKRIFQKTMWSYLQRTVVWPSRLPQLQLMYRTYTQNLFMKDLTIPWLVYTIVVLFPKTQFVSLLLLRELNVNESFNFICKPEQDPQVSKSQESSPSECNFKDFESLESLNRNRSSFAKKLLQDYRYNLLTKLHRSNQGISPIKNPPKEHL